MLKLKSLEIVGFKGVKQANVSFPDKGVVFIEGVNKFHKNTNSNAAGKSTIPDALSFAIHGCAIQKLNKADLIPWPELKLPPGYVKVVFYDTVKKYEMSIQRWLTKSTAEIVVDGRILKIDSDAVGSYIGQDFRTFRNIHLLTREDSFVLQTKSKRMELFERFTGLDEIVNGQVKKAVAIYHESNNEVIAGRAKVDILSQELVDLKAKLDEISGIDTSKTSERLNKVHILLNRIRKFGFEKKLNSVVWFFNQYESIISAKLEEGRRAVDTTDDRIKTAQEEIDNLLREVTYYRKGICKLCGNRMKKSKIKTELKRLGEIICARKSSKSALIAELNRSKNLVRVLVSKERRRAEISLSVEANVSSVLSEIDGIVDDLRKSARQFETELAITEDRLTRAVASLKEIEESLKTAKSDLIEAKKFDDIASDAQDFVKNRLRRIITKSYIQSYNKDLAVTLDLIAGFTGEFTEDFDILIGGKKFNSRSTGEQMRFVLANYLNLFRYSAAVKNRFNLLIFDDFDAGVDESGKLALADVLNKLGESIVIMVISQSEVFNESFRNRITATIETDGIIHYDVNIT